MSGNAHCAGGKVTDRLGLDRSDASVLGYLKVISPFPPHNEMIYPKQTIIKVFLISYLTDSVTSIAASLHGLTYTTEAPYISKIMRSLISTFKFGNRYVFLCVGGDW